MNADVMVSVVIPCYNYGQYLAEALESALNQTHSPIEVIVVDDGSTDSTPDVCREYANRVKVVRQQNGGLPSSRNRGIQVAKGMFIAFLDADDILEPTYLERTLRAFHENADLSIGFVYTQMTLFGREQGITTFPEFEIGRASCRE